MALRSPAEADRYIEEMEQLGLTDSIGRKMRADVAEARAKSHAMADDAAQRHFDTTHTIGSETKTEFDSITEQAEAVGTAVGNGEMSPEEGRQALDSLLARHNRASARAVTFEDAADACVRIEEDPEGHMEAFYRAHPTVRPEFEW